MQVPLFTIGIASYNYAKYIVRLLDSIKNQLFQDFEILISDDCSTDNSLEVIKAYMAHSRELNIRLITSERNEGLISNKNKLIRNSKGEYLILCDADDWMDPKCLLRMSEVIRQENPDRVISEIANIDESGKVVQIQKIPVTQTKWGWNIHHGSAYKRKILVDNDILIRGYPDDLYLTVEFAKYCQKMSIIHEVLYYWYVHTDSAGRNFLHIPADQYAESYFNDTIGFLETYIKDIKKGEHRKSRDIDEIKLLQLKMYYFGIFFNMQKASLKDKIVFYNIMHKQMALLDDNYLNNIFLRRRQRKNFPLRSYAKMAITFSAFMEKYHLIYIEIISYHLLTYIVYFDQ